MIHPKIDQGVAKFEGSYAKDECWKVGQRLTIGKIINHKGEEVSSLMLEPQGIAHLISAEKVRLPEGVCGLAHVLTGMCNNGLLTLNIGVVDPGWHNHLSSPVLNFSSERRLIQKGDHFIRVTYHDVRLSPDVSEDDKQKFKNCNEEEYGRDIRARAVSDFGKSFLNIKQLVGKASRKESLRFREAMLKYIPIGAFSLAVFALLVTIGVATVTRMAGSDRQDEILRRLDRIERSMEERVSAGATPAPQDTAGSRSNTSGRQP